jgi:hypothetical protein
MNNNNKVSYVTICTNLIFHDVFILKLLIANILVWGTSE